MSILKLYLKETLNNLNKEFIREAIKGNTEAARNIIAEDPNVVNYQDERSGITGLMIFTADGCGSMVDLICSTPEADVHLEDNMGRTAGFMAIAIGREDIRTRIDDRVTENLRNLGLLDEDDVEDNESTENVVKFPSPKGGSDPKP